MVKSKKFKLSGLARRLVNSGLLTEPAAVEVSLKSADERISFASFLIKYNMLSPIQLAVQSSLEFGLPLLDLDAFDLDNIPKSTIKPQMMEKSSAMPLFQRGKRLFVAISDPTNQQALDELKFHVGGNIDTVLVEDDKLKDAIHRVVSMAEVAALEDGDASLSHVKIQGEGEVDADDAGETQDTPIVRFINKILLDAINTGASDVHFEPFETMYRVRLRQDGILHEAAKPPPGLGVRLATRLKVMANLDISERRIPQDGRCKMRLSKNKSIDFRVSTCPTLYGEKIVLRILDPTSTQMGINALGYEEFQKELFLKAIHQPQGMVLVTGPTGSGKTVSLYTALDILNTDERNISTCEDPVEINLPGINQVNVNVKAGLGFAEALRAFLRQDPDIVMVGEIRDLETAEIAVKAAQTGHLVLSTLHTNSAADTLTRLINMGVPSYNLATSVILIIAQRLTRRLCEICRREAIIPDHALAEIGFKKEELEGMTIFEAAGCNKCKNGYKGRVGIYEVMPITNEIAQLIMAGANPIEIAKQARESGVWNLRKAGLEKIRQGLTTLEEVYRVTRED